MNLSFKKREFLRTFPTVFEYEDGDTGFFVDVTKGCLVFIRVGKVIDGLPFKSIMDQDPEASFEAWRRKFRSTDQWRPGRDRD